MVRGTREGLARLDSDVIVPFVDLDGLGAGEYALTVHVDPVADAGVARVEPETVNVPADRCKANQIDALFGTDGVRGKAGQYPLDAATVRRLGAALVRALPHGTESPRLLVGRDTRESGGWIEGELAHGAAGEGASRDQRRRRADAGGRLSDAPDGYDAGVVISASHNPFEDNGIKVFSGRGEKFTERVEREVEAIVADRVVAGAGGRSRCRCRRRLSSRAYLDHLRAVIAGSPTPCGACGWRSTAPTARRRRWRRSCSERSGFDAIVIGDQPDGRNINLRLRIDAPRAAGAGRRRAAAAQLGVAFDGDGDRAIFVDGADRSSTATRCC